MLLLFVLSDLSFFFFKQKTAYEMRISDWSSDVCSSDHDDLLLDIIADAVPHPPRGRWPILQRLRPALEVAVVPALDGPARYAQLLQRALGRQVPLLDDPNDLQLLGCGLHHSSSALGRESCRARVCTSL